jgi:hypothetical protein
MGAWGELAFDNDTANDWASDLQDSGDLSLVDASPGFCQRSSAATIHGQRSIAGCEPMLVELTQNTPTWAAVIR